MFCLRHPVWPQLCLGGFFHHAPLGTTQFLLSLPCRGSFCPFPTQRAWIYSCPAPVALYAPCPNLERLALLLPHLRRLVSSVSCSGHLLVPLAPHGVSRFAPAPLRADSVAHATPGPANTAFLLTLQEQLAGVTGHYSGL